MDRIFTVLIEGNFFYDGDEKVECSPIERNWIDSYWTDEDEAIKEADRLWSKSEEGQYDRIIVFERKLNLKGQGANLWNGNNDRFVKSWH